MKKTEIKKLEVEIKKSILISQDKKDFLVKNLEFVTEETLKQLFEEFLKSNKTVDLYIDKAIEKDLSLLTKLKQQVLKLKNGLLKLKEKMDINLSEQFLINELNKIK